IGLNTEMLRSKPFSGAADSGLNFIGDEKNAVLAAHVVEDAEVVPRRHDKTTFAKHGLGNQRRDGLGSNNPLEGIFQMMPETLGGCALPSAISVGERNPVYVAPKKRKTGFIGMRPARQRHPQHPAALKSIFEANHRPS